ncbi:hypothetical protein ACFVIM_32440 [Streptomyces sp. NPDC057638]|uniref:hypothetical protein n=1 Tax=Streptomyces sp. NPDC057638 TaxID=3346190 RepID=UPI003699C54C
MRTSTKALLGLTGTSLVAIIAATLGKGSLAWLWAPWAILALVTVVVVRRDQRDA